MASSISGGGSITTTDELVAALVDHVGVELTPIGDVVTAIGPAQGYEFTFDEEPSPEMPHLIPTTPGSVWVPWAPLGQIWIIDTEAGPTMVHAMGNEQGPELDEAIATLDRVLETIEFTDPDG